MIDIFAYTSPGARAFNEDFVGYARTPDGAVIALCDGLGGYIGGEFASSIAADAIIDEPYECADDCAWLRERLLTADRRIKEEQRRAANSMKTTAVALRLYDSRAIWAYAGDSRLYHVRDGAVREVTEDHSVAYQKYRAGQITRDRLATDEDRNTLLSSLGGEGEPRIDFGATAVIKGDGLLLCSDGFWEQIRDAEIAFDHLKAASAEEWARLLLTRVLDRAEKGIDNLSVITAIIR